jgi:hypothetical protein
VKGRKAFSEHLVESHGSQLIQMMDMRMEGGRTLKSMEMARPGEDEEKVREFLLRGRMPQEEGENGSHERSEERSHASEEDKDG